MQVHEQRKRGIVYEVEYHCRFSQVVGGTGQTEPEDIGNELQRIARACQCRLNKLVVIDTSLYLVGMVDIAVAFEFQT